MSRGTVSPRRPPSCPFMLVMLHGGVSSPIDDISLSIILGCSRAPSLARVATHTVFNSVRNTFTDIQLRLYQHVDDYTIILANTNAVRVLNDRIQVARHLHTKLNSIGAITSTKTTIVSNNNWVANTAVKTVCRYGVPAQHSKAAVDVDSDIQFKRRSVAKQRQRISAANKRSRRTARLIKVDSRIKRLALPGVAAVQDCTSAACGPRAIKMAQANKHRASNRAQGRGHARLRGHRVDPHP